MPVYKPESETIGSNSTESEQVIDDDLIISSISINLSGYTKKEIELSINGSLKDTSVISGNETKNITTLVVTIRIKS